VNGEIGEVTELSGRLNLRQFTQLRCIKYVKSKGDSPLDDDSTVFESQMTNAAKKPDFADQEMNPSTTEESSTVQRTTTWADANELAQDLGLDAQTKKIWVNV